MHELLITEHEILRQDVAEVRKAAAQGFRQLNDVFPPFQKHLSQHIRKEDSIYYRLVDEENRIKDRDLTHALRNDHAAALFTLESLAIRLRKACSPDVWRAGPLEDWKKRFNEMAKALQEHFEREERELFPVVDRMLSPAQKAALRDELNKAS